VIRVRAVIVNPEGEIRDEFWMVATTVDGVTSFDREDGLTVDLSPGWSLVMEQPSDPRDAAPFN
jgi:hypothetical protein